MNDATTPRPERSWTTGALLGLLAACLVLATATVILGSHSRHLAAELPAVQSQFAGAQADAAQARGELATARAEAAELRTQLSGARSSCADMQAQLDRSKAVSADLATQADSARADGARQAAALKAQLDQAEARAADAQGQLSQAAAAASQLQVQFGEARARTLYLETRLQKAEGDVARLQVVAQKARHLPVTTFIDRVSSGFTTQVSYTLSINSLQVDPLKVDITITGQRATRTQSSVAAYGATLRVDRLQSGETVRIASDGFDPLSVTVP